MSRSTRHKQHPPKGEAGEIFDRLFWWSGPYKELSKVMFIALFFITAALLLKFFYYSYKAENLMKSGTKYEKSENFKEATACFKRALYYKPELAVAYTLTGECYLRAGDLSRARIYFKRGAGSRNPDGLSYYYLGFIYGYRGDSENMHQVIREARVRLYGENALYADLLELAAGALFPGEGELEKTDEQYRLIRQKLLRSENIFVIANTGLLDIYRGHFREAGEIFEGLSKAHPENSYFFTYLAIAVLEDGKSQEASSIFLRALDLNNNNPVANEYLGYYYLEKNMIEEGATYIQTAYAASPGFADANYFLGELYLRKGDLKKAQTYFERCLELQSGPGKAHQRLGEIYQKLHLDEKAEEEIRKAADANTPVIFLAPRY